MKLLFFNNTISSKEIEYGINNNKISYNLFIKSSRKCNKPMVFNGKKSCSSCSGR